MSTRSPIQVPEELKTEVDNMKDEFRAKTHYEVIEKLIKSHESFKKYREEVRQEKEKDKQLIQAEYVRVGDWLKEAFIKARNELNLKSDEQLMEFLLNHYHESQTFSKQSLILLNKFK